MTSSLSLHNNKSLDSTDLSGELLLNNIYACYLLINTDMTVHFFNIYYAGWYKKYFGRDIRKGSNLLELIAPERRPILEDYFIAAINGACIEYELPFTDNNGVTDWYFIRINAIRNNDAEVIGLSMYFADITKRKQTETALKASNERYEFVSKITSDAIWDWNLLDNKLFWSEGYHTSFGYRKSDDHNTIETWKEGIHPEDRERVLLKMATTLADSNASYWEDEYRYIKADGNYAYIYDKGHVIYEEGRAVRMVGAMTDITSRKMYEIDREEMTTELIQRNKDLEQFAFIISHNLRSQIANVLGLSELLKSGLLQPDELEVIFNQVHSSVQKLDEVVKDINHILHIKRNIAEKKEVVFLEALFNDVCDSQRKFIEENDVVISCDFSQVPAIFGLKSYLHSIFYNLISNSIKYRQADLQPHLSIISKLDFNKVILRFQDNGMGIDLNVHGKSIFGLYKRFHLSKEGKGMGLFMVKTQVEAQGGKIDVVSELGQGSCFILSFNKDDSIVLP